jgi:hypothetical protein
MSATNSPRFTDHVAFDPHGARPVQNIELARLRQVVWELFYNPSAVERGRLFPSWVELEIAAARHCRPVLPNQRT